MIVDLVNDTTTKTNLVKAVVMTVLYPLTKYDQQGKEHKPLSRLNTLELSDTFTKRIAELEKRQVLVEADLALLQGQLHYENALRE